MSRLIKTLFIVAVLANVVTAEKIDVFYDHSCVTTAVKYGKLRHQI